MIMNHLRRQQNHPTKSEQSVEVPLNRYLSSISIVKSSARFFVALLFLVAIVACGDGITGQVVGVRSRCSVARICRQRPRMTRAAVSEVSRES